MALPRNARNGFTPEEIDFLAEVEDVTVLPLEPMEPLQLINGTYGPFRPAIKLDVPLWLAVTLKKKQKCKIQPPEWMDTGEGPFFLVGPPRTSRLLTYSVYLLHGKNILAEELQAKLDEETNKPEFSSLPFHYMEIAHALLDCASDDIPNAETVRTLLRDLREKRQAKARQGLETLDTQYLQMDGLGLMEINEIRPFFTKAFDALRKLTPAPAEGTYMTE
ncbi:DNA replication protein psf2 [Borealophlyctis nickersoniae]|nr:DNA replication protein psf2 [Borealophlyctis nickersoniae]